MNKEKRITIAVDGYSSCGKSTFAKEIAKIKAYTYIDSGAMYRATTLYCLENGLVKDGELLVAELIGSLDMINISFGLNKEKGAFETYLNGELVEDKIRSVAVASLVSPVAVIKEVRDKMVTLQREMGKDKGIVMDGRDIGTVVFPNAELKIFMTASPEIRAKRRYDEMLAKGEKVNYDEIEKNVRDRDRIDEGREISPLRKADDAILLDNSHISVEEQMLWVKGIIEERLK